MRIFLYQYENHSLLNVLPVSVWRYIKRIHDVLDFVRNLRYTDDRVSSESLDTQQWERLNTAYGEYYAMSIDDLEVDKQKAIKQYVFWTAVAVMLGFLMFIFL